MSFENEEEQPQEIVLSSGDMFVGTVSELAQKVLGDMEREVAELDGVCGHYDAIYRIEPDSCGKFVGELSKLITDCGRVFDLHVAPLEGHVKLRIALAY